MEYTLPLEVIQAAHQRIAPYIRHTPLLPLPAFGRDLPTSLRLKLENMQVSGSFKARGVFNNLLQLEPQQRTQGVIAASGGNHGLALAYAAQRLGIRATIYLPALATADRVERVMAWDARVFQYGDSWDEANVRAQEHAAHEGLVYIHPFDADYTLAGPGTLGLELFDDLPDLDCVLIAVGGGGLIAGMAAAIKQVRPTVQIIGVEPVGAASMSHSLKVGRVEALTEVHTIADTLSPRAVSMRTLALTQQYVDAIVLVEDAQMIAGMRWLWRECNQLVEPSGAAVIAALLGNQVDISIYTRPVALICGGNAAADSVFATYGVQ